jgi:hypothetical protein
LNNPKPEVSAITDCQQLFNKYIHSYPLYVEAVSSICNLRTHHIVTGTIYRVVTSLLQQQQQKRKEKGGLFLLIVYVL